MGFVSKKPPKPMKRSPMKRSGGFKKKEPTLETDEPKIQKYVKPVREPKPPKERKPMKQVGKRVAKRIKINAGLKLRFLRWGITYCEFGYPGCWREVQGFAHSKKSRHLVTDEDWEEVVAACNVCHDKCEEKGEGLMTPIIRRIIEQRMARLAKWVSII